MAGNGLPRFDRLLLIDDEPGLRKVLTLDLEADGYQVLTAEDGPRGLALFAREWPDIVLTDIKMPGIDGLEVLRRVKELRPLTEVIVITGHGDMDLAIRALQLEASDFVTKPIDDQALAVALRRARERLTLKAEVRAYTTDLEARVREATARVLAKERLAAVGEMVSVLTHSLKNTLSGLEGGLYFIRYGLERPESERLQQGLEMLERNVQRVKDLTQDLLSLAKTRTPKRELVDLRHLAGEVIEMLGHTAERRGVTVAVLAGSPGPVVEVDRNAILDALTNLVTNAIDAAASTAQGRVEVTVENYVDEAGFRVSDNGPGIPAEIEPHLFQGFFSTKGSAGTGLGLMTVKKVVEEHGGRVAYESARGKSAGGGGAVFSILLPKTATP
ncbi:MAG: hybrid sensor histidine kinase/response regulator [Planctomycetota bacterium]